MAEPITSPHDDEKTRYRVTRMDCPSCPAKIERAAREVRGVNEVKVSIASQLMTLRVGDAGSRS